MRWLRDVARVALIAVLLASVVAAAEETVGSVAALEGQADALHPGQKAWVALAAGDGVLLGDQLRTGVDARLRLLFRDDSVLTMAASSQLTVTEQVAGAQAPVSRFSLLMGSVRAIVTERYGKPGARFEVETPTAVAGVRGTGFIASYDSAVDETVIVGLFDTTRVRARVHEQAAKEVLVNAGYSTRVRRGSYPIRPTLTPDAVLRSLSAATDLPTGGAAPDRQLTPPGAKPSATAPIPQNKGAANAPEQKAIDQPVDQLLRHRGQGIPPPPPPPPPHG